MFLSGTRDALAERELPRGIVDDIGPRAELVWLDTADHSYKVLKRSRARSDTVFEELLGFGTQTPAHAAMRFTIDCHESLATHRTRRRRMGSTAWNHAAGGPPMLESAKTPKIL